MRRVLPYLLCLLAAGPALGQDLELQLGESGPAVEGRGASSTTIEALKDTVSVTLGGEGDLGASTASGEASANGEVGIGLGDHRLLGIAGSAGIDLPGLAIDRDNNGRVDDAERKGALRFAADAGDCDGLIVSSSSVEQIGTIDAEAPIQLVMVCADPAGLDPSQRAAIAANSALMERLTSSGFGPADVAGITLEQGGRGTIYLSAS